MTHAPLFLGIDHGHVDPAVALVRDGKILAFSEEERHSRNKHAAGAYPMRALRACLQAAGASLADVAELAVNWDLAGYNDGRIARFFAQMREAHPVDARTVAWQDGLLRRFQTEAFARPHHLQWRRTFGDVRFPPIVGYPHHYTHAFMACLHSGFDRSVCVTLDGSGDEHCTVVWRHEGTTLTPLRELRMPHSLGWVYAAITEYLGFRAYDGEYKVMGLAAYGEPNPDLRARVDRIVAPADDGVEYRVDPAYLHYGPRSWSERFTDRLVELFGRRPRLPDEEITQWHEDLAFAVQANLEDTVARLVRWAVRETGIDRVTVGGGVGLNIKMNSRLFELPEVRDVWAHPLCSDSGAAAGAALLACLRATGRPPERLESLALGHEESEASIEAALRIAHLDYRRPDDLAAAVADELAAGRVVGWFQGRMEAGPRALGQRSILADPRRTENRDRVNAIIKFREYWRPFCPSMTYEAAPRYFARWTEAPFMIIAFSANERLAREAPAIVHVDGTSRVQLVKREVHPRYHELLAAFERKTGVPVLLNTSFNVKGEPIVCTIQDALRTFWSTGLEVLAAGPFLLRKPGLEASA